MLFRSYVVAYMTEQLQVKPNHRVLEVGTGSGYQAAVLLKLAREVVTLERYRTLANSARRSFNRSGVMPCSSISSRLEASGLSGD